MYTNTHAVSERERERSTAQASGIARGNPLHPASPSRSLAVSVAPQRQVQLLRRAEAPPGWGGARERAQVCT